MNYSRPPAARRSERRSDRRVMMEANKCDDWEFVYSQAGAISGFHVTVLGREGSFI